MFNPNELKTLSEFNIGYSFNFLSNIDKNVHKTMLTKFFQNNIKENLTVFDIGCNAGSFIKVFQQMGTGHIHCFEPHPILSKYLNETYSNITTNSYCISNYDGEGNIYFPSRSVALGSTVYRDIFNTFKVENETDPIWKSTKPQEIITKKVPFMTIDTYCTQNNIEHIDYIKIDVEGGEFNVFRGAERMLKEKRITAGQYEANQGGECLRDAGVTYKEIKTFLEKYGYVVEQLCPGDCYFEIGH